MLSEDVTSLHKKVDAGSELVVEVAGLKGLVAGLAGGGLGGGTRLC